MEVKRKLSEKKRKKVKKSKKKSEKKRKNRLEFRFALFRFCAAKALFSCPAIISQRLEPRITSNEPLENTEEESKII